MADSPVLRATPSSLRVMRNASERVAIPDRDEQRRAVRRTALDVVSLLFRRRLSRGARPNAGLDMEHRCHGSLRAGCSWPASPCSRVSRPAGTTSAPPTTTGGDEDNCRCASNSAWRFLSRAFRSSARCRAFAEFMPLAGSRPGEFPLPELGGPMVPVPDLGLQPCIDRVGHPVNPVERPAAHLVEVRPGKRDSVADGGVFQVAAHPVGLDHRGRSAQLFAA